MRLRREASWRLQRRREGREPYHVRLSGSNGFALKGFLLHIANGPASFKLGAGPSLLPLVEYPLVGVSLQEQNQTR